MSASAPFALSSKCVSRLKSDPDVIVENTHLNDDDDTAEETKPFDETQNLAPQRRISTSSESDGRTESGWIFRNCAENVPSHVQKQSCGQKSNKADGDKFQQPRETETEAVSALSSQERGPPCSLSMRCVLPLQGLPHPSDLRKKPGAGTKRNREVEKDHPVEKHIQQLKKKKVAYFCTESEAATKKSPKTPAVTPASEETDTSTHGTPALALPSTEAAKRSPDTDPDSEVAAVPPIVLPMTAAEDEDDHWFRTRWTSQHSKSQRPFEE